MGLLSLFLFSIFLTSALCDVDIETETVYSLRIEHASVREVVVDSATNIGYVLQSAPLGLGAINLETKEVLQQIEDFYPTRCKLVAGYLACTNSDGVVRVSLDDLNDQESKTLGTSIIGATSYGDNYYVAYYVKSENKVFLSTIDIQSMSLKHNISLENFELTYTFLVNENGLYLFVDNEKTLYKLDPQTGSILHNFTSNQINALATIVDADNGDIVLAAQGEDKVRVWKLDAYLNLISTSPTTIDIFRNGAFIYENYYYVTANTFLYRINLDTLVQTSVRIIPQIQSSGASLACSPASINANTGLLYLGHIAWSYDPVRGSTLYAVNGTSFTLKESMHFTTPETPVFTMYLSTTLNRLYAATYTYPQQLLVMDAPNWTSTKINFEDQMAQYPDFFGAIHIFMIDSSLYIVTEEERMFEIDIQTYKVKKQYKFSTFIGKIIDALYDPYTQRLYILTRGTFTVYTKSTGFTREGSVMYVSSSIRNIYSNNGEIWLVGGAIGRYSQGAVTMYPTSEEVDYGIVDFYNQRIFYNSFTSDYEWDMAIMEDVGGPYPSNMAFNSISMPAVCGGVFTYFTKDPVFLSTLGNLSVAEYHSFKVPDQPTLGTDSRIRYHVNGNTFFGSGGTALYKVKILSDNSCEVPPPTGLPTEETAESTTESQPVSSHGENTNENSSATGTSNTFGTGASSTSNIPSGTGEASSTSHLPSGTDTSSGTDTANEETDTTEEPETSSGYMISGIMLVSFACTLLMIA